MDTHLKGPTIQNFHLPEIHKSHNSSHLLSSMYNKNSNSDKILHENFQSMNCIERNDSINELLTTSEMHTKELNAKEMKTTELDKRESELVVAQNHSRTPKKIIEKKSMKRIEKVSTQTSRLVLTQEEKQGNQTMSQQKHTSASHSKSQTSYSFSQTLNRTLNHPNSPSKLKSHSARKRKTDSVAIEHTDQGSRMAVSYTAKKPSSTKDASLTKNDEPFRNLSDATTKKSEFMDSIQIEYYSKVCMDDSSTTNKFKNCCDDSSCHKFVPISPNQAVGQVPTLTQKEIHHQSQKSHEHAQIQVQDSHFNSNSNLFSKPIQYYQKKIIFACKDESNRYLSQMVLRLGRMHQSDLIARSHADTILRLLVEEYVTQSEVESKIFYWHPDIRLELIQKADLKAVYNARVDRLLQEVVKKQKV